MTEEQKKALETIEQQVYGINARNISMPWIGMRKTPTFEEIRNLNRLLGFVILELRTLRETGELDVDELHKKHFGGENG